MLLLPPSDAADTRPVYHISVDMNVIVPTSIITTIRRGGSNSGELVGQFELGMTIRLATVFTRGKEHTINRIMQRTGVSLVYIFIYIFRH